MSTVDKGSPRTPRSVEEHARAVDALLGPVLDRLGVERLAVDAPELPGRILAEDQGTGFPLPPFDNSQMDGFAVRAADLAEAREDAPVVLPVGWATAAGDPPQEHAAGTASPIMTGAAVPLGADAIVPVEAVSPPDFPPLARHGAAGSGPSAPSGEITVTAPVEPGTFVRTRGVDLPEGAPLAAAGQVLTAALIGSLAAAGIAQIPVRSRLRVLVCTTGDELSDTGTELAPGRIHDANAPMLAAALRQAGALVRIARVEDRAEDLARVLREAHDVDLALTSGGISAGAFEVVKDALAPLGGDFTSVAMQPGGPQGLAEVPRETGGSLPVLCFPGNPVSSLLSAEVFLLPAVRRAAGAAVERIIEPRPLSHDTVSPKTKRQFRRGRIGPDGSVSVSGPGSHLLAAMAGADVIVEIPVGVEQVDAGTIVDTWRIR